MTKFENNPLETITNVLPETMMLVYNQLTDRKWAGPKMLKPIRLKNFDTPPFDP